MDVYQRRRLVALSILAGVFVVIVLLVRSCGDDDETPVTPVSGATGATGPGGATSLSQNEFIDEGDATCLESNTALASVDDSDPTVAATEEGQILAGELDSLQTLPPPTDGEDDLEDFLSALQDQVAAYDRYITALERGDETAAAELEAEIDDAGRQARKRARQFGFEVCGDTSEVGESGGGEETTTEGVEGVEGGAVEPAPTEAAPIAPVEPVTPAPTVPTPAPEPAPAPPAEGGGATPAPAPAPPSDGGGGTGSGGVSP